MLTVGDSVFVVFISAFDCVLGFMLTVGEKVSIVPACASLGFRLIAYGSVCTIPAVFKLAVGDSTTTVFTFVAGWLLGIMLTVGESVCIAPAFALLGLKLIMGGSVCIIPDFKLLGLKLTVGRSDPIAFTFVIISALGFVLTLGIIVSLLFLKGDG